MAYILWSADDLAVVVSRCRLPLFRWYCVLDVDDASNRGYLPCGFLNKCKKLQLRPFGHLFANDKPVQFLVKKNVNKAYCC